ncbi:transporter substrate-binding domain-containing protein [Niveispirillum sp. KHB5.9]|uniref:transporter substrate-binding domain-containing protein n=1 Tax=Niveispirillum sp. KHB5.9 TaxID=3400269 RepID=UPI003A86CE8D
MKKLMATLALAGLMALTGCGKDEAKKEPSASATAGGVPNPLRVATEGAYPPYNMVDAGGNLVGFEIDMMKDICKRIGTECQFQAQAWDGMIPALQAGRFDAIVAGMSITDERLAAVDFSSGYTTTPAYLVSANANPLQDVEYGLERIDLTEISADEQAAIDKIKGLLKGKVLGVQTSTIHANFVDKYLADVVDIRRYDTQENLALDLQTGRVEIGLADAITWNAFLQRPEGKDFSYFGPGFDGGLFGRGQGIAIAKGRPELLAALNKAIADMKADGAMKNLSVQWFGFDSSMP